MIRKSKTNLISVTFLRPSQKKSPLLKNEDIGKSRVTGTMCLLGTETTGAINWQEQLNDNFDQLLEV